MTRELNSAWDHEGENSRCRGQNVKMNGNHGSCDYMVEFVENYKIKVLTTSMQPPYPHSFPPPSSNESEKDLNWLSRSSLDIPASCFHRGFARTRMSMSQSHNKQTQTQRQTNTDTHTDTHTHTHTLTHTHTHTHTRARTHTLTHTHTHTHTHKRKNNNTKTKNKTKNKKA